MSEPITIDGSQGEGGGQIVRTALALSCITDRPLRMINVRAGRPKPGLGHQHLTSIRAAQQISSAEVSETSIGSKQFTFKPGPVRAGSYSFDVGTAGSTALVLQTVALPLALADGTSNITITGGTHNPMAPCYEYLEAVWAPLLALVNIHIQFEIKRAGFYPVGGGRIEANIVGVGFDVNGGGVGIYTSPSPRLRGEGRGEGLLDQHTSSPRPPSPQPSPPADGGRGRIGSELCRYQCRGGEGRGEGSVVVAWSAGRLRAVTIEERGETCSIEGFSAVARLSRSIAERQAKRAELRLAAAGFEHFPLNVQTIEAASPGTVLFLNCRCSACPAAFFALGERGKPAERVAEEAVDQLIEHFSRPGALDPHAADQFVLPLSLAPGSSCFTTSRVTDHLVTHVELLRQFLDRPIDLSGRVGESGRVRIGQG